MTESAQRVTFGDARRVGFCARGQRAWFEARGLDYLDFVKHGIEVEKLRALKDGYADRMVELAERGRG